MANGTSPIDRRQRYRRLLVRGELAMTGEQQPLDTLVAKAYQMRPEMKLALDDEKSAELRYQFSSFGTAPVVKLDAIYGFKNGFFPDLNVLRGNLIASAGVTVPLFDGGRTGDEEQEAQAELNAAHERIATLERQVRASVETAMNDMQTAREKYQIAAVQVRQADEAIAIARQLYETGSATNLDLLDAETAALNANLNRLQTVYRFVVSGYELKRAVGGAWF